MLVYISGPISGIPDDNRAAFTRAVEYLASIGHDAINPLDIAATLPVDAEYPDYIRADVLALLDCEALYVLPGWQSSRGACVEVMLAKALDMRIIHA